MRNETKGNYASGKKIDTSADFSLRVLLLV